MTGFVVKNSGVASQEFNRKAEEVGQRQCSDGAAPAIAMAFRYHLSDRNGKKLKQGLRRTMMTSLAVANGHASVRPYVETSVATLLCRREAGRVQDLTVAENMSQLIQPPISAPPEAFLVLSSVYCTLSASARRLRIEIQQN
ncbi:hypothetical protein [Mesorhizobium sp. M0227]|uniref:hypothetical protein n=1 Tax=Mesorhizobium sp. M0227 TaxID=2956922 RepID=UPI00333CD8D6